jgi:prepilin-type N-terminal cleavage/methylation domain-containing protein
MPKAGRGLRPRRARPAAPGFSLVEALVALAVIGGAMAAALPPLARALAAKAERDAGVSAVLFAQSLLEAHAPPGAARPGRWEGPAPEGGWRVEIGPGEEGPRGVALRPVRVAVGGVVLLETLRPGPAEAGP